MFLSLSTSAFQDAAVCLKKYEYRWKDLLVPRPRDVRMTLRRGSWIHQCLAYMDLGLDWENEMIKMAMWATDNGVEQGDVEALMPEVANLVRDYQAYWSTHTDTPGPWSIVSAERTLKWRAREDREFTATPDVLAVDIEGHYWLWERKSTEQIPGSDWRCVDPQTMLQYVIARRNGLDIKGIVFDYVCTKPGAQIRVKQSDGRLYKGDESKVTTARQFELAIPQIRKHWSSAPTIEPLPSGEVKYTTNVDEYIQEMRMRVVNDGQWFQRYPVFRPDENAKQTLADIAFTARSIEMAEELGHYPRAFHPLNCRLFCQYGPLCMAEYAEGRKLPAHREEHYMRETPELRAAGRSEV